MLRISIASLSALSLASVAARSSCANEALLVAASQSCSLSGDTNLLSNPNDPSQFLHTDLYAESSNLSLPWSYPPFCTDFIDELDSELCVFTNSSFSHGRGISIFTTPSIAQEFATLRPFHDETALDDINQAGTSWYTQTLPGKGNAMMAKTNLERGDLITAFTPVLIVNIDQKLSRRQGEYYLRRAVDQLPAGTRTAYLSLSKMYNDPSVIVQDILKSNAFEIQIAGKMHLAIFPEPARLNHDCAPNAQYYLDPSLLTHFVSVTRPIAENEEITISCMKMKNPQPIDNSLTKADKNPFQDTKTRQAHLLKAFRFTCQCSLCTSPSSDDHLVEIQRLQQLLGDWNNPDAATRSDALELIRLYKSLELHSFLDMPYGFAALTYNSFGDTRRAVRYARLASEAVNLKDGSGAADFGLWKSIMDHPEGHWSWNYRVR